MTRLEQLTLIDIRDMLEEAQSISASIIYEKDEKKLKEYREKMYSNISKSTTYIRAILEDC